MAPLIEFGPPAQWQSAYPESVKAYLAKAGYSINRKDKVAEDLDRFYKYKGINWIRLSSGQGV